MVLQSEARPRHFIFNSLRRRASFEERARESCAYSNLNMTSLVTTSSRRTLLTNFSLHRFRLLAVFCSLKSKMQQASVFYSLQRHPSTTASKYPENWGQIDSNLKWNIAWVLEFVWSSKGE
jgi:hypothetical protein